MLIAIQAVHAYGVIHRRISAENLLLSDSGHLVLSNFSYCKVFDHNVDDETVHPQPKDPQSIEEAVNSGRIDYYRMALVYYQILTGQYLSFTASLVHGPIEPREDHMQTLTSEVIQFLSRILDNFPANSPHVSKITDSFLFNDIDWEAMCHQAVSVPLTHRVLRAKSSRSSVHFERVDEGEGGSR
ncbi:hypothetical protein BDN70DRAFT_880831 [Pholiota conissans]|uniref:Protein kinase domain-containing protein n=1 Tax=Pholiota conissans TaxID=109636 RepID=A0A9P6CZJ4_9AGAR|nr:hypothetical protein BDN70DRAFT_880831 [Pholiota conissans]